MSEWHLITGEYPPQPGGVSDYTRRVASGLVMAGDEVHVWCPGMGEEVSSAAGLVVHRSLGDFSPGDLLRADRMLGGFPGPRKLLVQWVPHSYGYRSINLGVCLWLWRRAAIHGDHVHLMVHEPYLDLRTGSWRQRAAAVVHRLMTIVLLRAAHRVWMSIPEWERCWRPYALGRRIPFTWLPVPSNVETAERPGEVAAVRVRYAPPSGRLVGHMGTYGEPIARLLLEWVPRLLAERPDTAVLLMGRGGEGVKEALAQRHPGIASRVHATGYLPEDGVADHLAACDLLIQPYPDGVSTRRTSVMAGLALGLPILTTAGSLTEPIWRSSQAVSLVPVDDPAPAVESMLALLDDAGERTRLGSTARAIYDSHFDLRHTVRALQRSAGGNLSSTGACECPAAESPL